jgi:hypothetical protein
LFDVCLTKVQNISNRFKKDFEMSFKYLFE